MIYCFDIDGTICDTNGNDYKNSIPREKMISKVNELYEDHYIKMFTARGCNSGIDWQEFTEQQLERWGLKCHEVICNKKPHYDLLVDDKAIHVDRWVENNLEKKVGFIAGCFDLIHPGYITMFKDAKTVCDHLLVGLQSDPTIDRPDTHKKKPVHSLEERKIILSGIKYIDEVTTYDTEVQLYSILQNKKIDVRILGDEYEETDYNGKDLDMKVYFHRRNSSWSTTKLRERILQQ